MHRRLLEALLVGSGPEGALGLEAEHVADLMPDLALCLSLVAAGPVLWLGLASLVAAGLWVGGRGSGFVALWLRPGLGLMPGCGVEG